MASRMFAVHFHFEIILPEINPIIDVPFLKIVTFNAWKTLRFYLSGESICLAAVAEAPLELREWLMVLIYTWTLHCCRNRLLQWAPLQRIILFLGANSDF